MPPLDIFQRLRAVADAHSLEFLLIGGHAVNAHGYARTTLDVDLLARVVQRSLWQAVLQGWGYWLLHETQAFSQYDPPTPSEMDLDIMFVDDSTFGKLAVEREMLTVGGATLPVAGVLHLIALKLHATRTPTREIEGKDFYDIVNLIRVHQIDPASAEFTEILDRYATASIRQRLLDEHARFSR